MTIEDVIDTIDSADKVELPNPDISILRQGRMKPPSFPLEVLSDVVSNWVIDAAEGAGAPVDYVIGALFSACTALIGNARRISPWEGWEEPIASWIGLVGNPSSGKSPAIDPVFKLMKKIEQEMGVGFKEKYKEYETKKAAAHYEREKWQEEVEQAIADNKDIPIIPDEAIEPEEVISPRILVNDVTTEKLAFLLSSHLKGLLFYRDELSGWLGGFGKYNGSKDSDRSFWLEAYGGRPYNFERIKHKLPINIPYLLVSVMGGIQPDKLNSLVQGNDDGLAARFLWFWPDSIPPTRPSKKIDNSYMLNTLRKIHSLSLDKDKDGRFISRIMPLTEEAATLFQEWRLEHYEYSKDAIGFLASSFGKSPGHLLHLAVALEYLWWAVSEQMDEPINIGAKAIAAAAHLIDTYFKPMAEHVFRDVSIPEGERLASTLAHYIVKTKPDKINLREISRNAHIPGLRKSDKVHIAASELVEASWLFVPPPELNNRGRPRSDYIVNPKLWEILK